MIEYHNWILINKLSIGHVLTYHFVVYIEESGYVIRLSSTIKCVAYTNDNLIHICTTNTSNQQWIPMRIQTRTITDRNNNTHSIRFWIKQSHTLLAKHNSHWDYFVRLYTTGTVAIWFAVVVIIVCFSVA